MSKEKNQGRSSHGSLHENNRVMDMLEEEHGSDLAVHLYSTFLLHRVNHFFPKRNWTAWPLPKSEVPDPAHTRVYSDAIVDDYYQDNNFLLEAEDELFNYRRLNIRKPLQNEVVPTLPESESEEEEESKQVIPETTFNKQGSPNEDANVSAEDNLLMESNIIDGSDSEDEVDNQRQSKVNAAPEEEESFVDEKVEEYQRPKAISVNSVTYTEKLSSPSSTLFNEIHGLIERKINERFKNNFKNKDKLTLSSDIYSKLTTDLTKKISNRVSHLVDDINLRFDSRRGSVLATKGAIADRRRLYDWQDILLANLSRDESRNKSINTKEHQRIYEKCEQLFHYPKFKFEYVDPEIYSDNHHVDNNANSEPPRQNNNHSRKRRRFDLGEYLTQLDEVKAGGTIKDLKRRVFERHEELRDLYQFRKLLFFRKLKLQENLGRLSYHPADYPLGKVIKGIPKHSGYYKTPKTKRSRFEKKYVSSDPKEVERLAELPEVVRPSGKKMYYLPQFEENDVIKSTRIDAINRGTLQLNTAEFQARI